MKSAVYFPLRFYSMFLVATILVFAFGPWPWPSRYSWEVYGYMALVFGAMNIGYRAGGVKRYGEYIGKKSPIQLYRLGLYLTLILFLPTLFWRTGGGYEFSLELLLNPAVAYLKSHDADNFSGTAWIEYIRIVVAVFLNMVLPLLIVYWERLTVSDRVLGIFAVFLEVFLWLAIGTNKGIGDLVVGFFWMFVLRKKSAFDIKSILKLSAATAPILILFAVFFTQGQIGRHDGYGVQTELHAIDISADRDNIFIRDLPEVAQDGVIAFSSYLVQGYHGLALSFDEPFVFTWGAGNSRFLTSYFDKYLGTDVEKTTYPARVEKTTGWDSKVRWHTMFPWWASDVTFPGVIVLVFVFSYIFALVWKDSLYTRNPYAISLSLQFATMFTYMSANNQAFQSGPAVIGFVVTLVVWIRTRKEVR
ncbi:MAG TPA: hypothetical protein PKX51_19440 [Cyclobacteriaceae bacterium]|nr:hypothetical protein [Accumulibacter sp.]HMW17800.1 hypothetical protein [Accumulibacter sp.]HND44506.1 hypothetical protein [Cyclobacteriaceae bacterium]HNO57746.1 hypothetical protein [Accumulibacter sp.]